MQSTGFEQRLPTGTGLLTFTTVDDACAALDTLDEAYVEHCEAARHLAETHLDARAVLGSMLERVGL